MSMSDVFGGGGNDERGRDAGGLTRAQVQIVKDLTAELAGKDADFEAARQNYVGEIERLYAAKRGVTAERDRLRWQDAGNLEVIARLRALLRDVLTDADSICTSASVISSSTHNRVRDAVEQPRGPAVGPLFPNAGDREPEVIRDAAVEQKADGSEL